MCERAVRGALFVVRLPQPQESNAMTTKPNLPDGFDATDPETNANGIPFAALAELRRAAPVWWNPQPIGIGGYQDEGYWVVSKHADILEVSRDSEMYSSRENSVMVRMEDHATREKIESQRLIMLNMDGAEHSKMRRIVARGFTPRAIARLRSKLTDRAALIVAEAAEKGYGNFVDQIAAELPLQAIAELIGVPQEDRHKLFSWSNAMTGRDDPKVEGDPDTALMQILGYSYDMAEDRKKCPVDDIASQLVQADMDGESLGAAEFGFFVILLAVAGSETTRSAITAGMLAFLENPEQWDLYRRERPTTAIDEIIRWATPVMSFQRTATRDTVLGGQEIKAGDRLAMMYSSGNFDEDVFTDPKRFDIQRSPNPHLSFGGHGAHYCIGANLARLEIELIFDAIIELVPDLRKISEPERLRSAWLNGIRAVDFEYQSSTVR